MRTRGGCIDSTAAKGTPRIASQGREGNRSPTGGAAAGNGGEPGALRRGTEKNRVRGYETRRRLIELHVYQHMGLGECAQALDLSYGRTLAQWHRIVAEVQDGEVPEEQLHDVRTHCDQMLRHMITTSLPLVAKSAAYGMLVLKALDGLCRLHGVARPEAVAGGPGPATLAEIGARVRVVSPLMIDKLDRVRALGSQVDGFVERLLDLKVSLYWHSQRVETMLEGGKRNPAAGMMLAVLAEMALAERETLRERILSGLENARRRGRKLGRPVGTVMTPGQLLERHSGIV
ncbi:MAG: recombinase family protein, partial [Verrucomicrobia bacterium]|nr:recombinase family protein [Verrucomicrobiota bacterium]